MNKILLVSKTLLMTLLLLSSFQAVASDNLETTFTMTTEEDVAVLDRLNNISSTIEVKFTEEVRDRIDNYVHEYPQGSEKILGRVSVYFPLIENLLREKNLPDDLKYLAVVESALTADASSKSGAKGLWQFMKGTGKMYGLKINSVIDERKDPYKATEAALEYLSDLHEQFGDWTLALAAYNCGPGNMRKAIRRSGGKRNYWEIREFLPQETREYIPRHIAASYLMHYYYMYDINPEMLDGKLTNTSTAKTYMPLTFNDLSTTTGVDIEDIKFLNPSYIKQLIPNSNGDNYLTLPSENMSRYIESYGTYEDLLHTIQNERLINRNEMMREKREERILSVIDAIEPKLIYLEKREAIVKVGSIDIFPSIEALRPRLSPYFEKRKAYSSL
jgi:membrane-bound lytic murein transglycosylase D